jgi:hypothetical protein
MLLKQQRRVAKFTAPQGKKKSIYIAADFFLSIAGSAVWRKKIKENQLQCCDLQAVRRPPLNFSENTGHVPSLCL